MSKYVKCPLRKFMPCDPMCGFAVWNKPGNRTDRVSSCAVAVLGSHIIDRTGEATIHCVPLPKEPR